MIGSKSDVDNVVQEAKKCAGPKAFADGRIDGLSKIYFASHDSYANSLAESMYPS